MGRFCQRSRAVAILVPIVGRLAGADAPIGARCAGVDRTSALSLCAPIGTSGLFGRGDPNVEPAREPLGCVQSRRGGSLRLVGHGLASRLVLLLMRCKEVHGCGWWASRSFDPERMELPMP